MPPLLIGAITILLLVLFYITTLVIIQFGVLGVMVLRDETVASHTAVSLFIIFIGGQVVWGLAKRVVQIVKLLFYKEVDPQNLKPEDRLQEF